MKITPIELTALSTEDRKVVLMYGAPGDAPGSGVGISVGFEVGIPGYPKAIFESQVWVAGLDGDSILEAVAIAEELAAEDED
jgi:hypothetical protein